MTYYKTGEFAKMANLSIRTIRYYDKIDLLKPTYVKDNGYRMYSDQDFLKLQKILCLKSLGFSLDDILTMTLNESYMTLQDSLSLQKKMIDQKIDNLMEMKKSIEKTEKYIKENQLADWTTLLKTIQFTSMEKDLVKQYKDSTNIDIRIRLHEKYSLNPLHWFEWLYQQYALKPHDRILEIGCGNGELWIKNKQNIQNNKIILSDISQGMLDDAKNNLNDLSFFDYQCFDCHSIPYPNESFDIIIANHVLFYVEDLQSVLKEISRVLKPNGYFYCSTYGKQHMKEITELIKEFNPKITLSTVQLYDVFGLENGYQKLSSVFSNIQLKHYEDSLEVDDPDDITNYILSCHGNQIEYILKDSEMFKKYILKKVKPSFHITKEAGLFICKK